MDMVCLCDSSYGIPDDFQFFIRNLSFLKEYDIVGSFCWPTRKKKWDEWSSKTDNSSNYEESYHWSIRIDNAGKKSIKYHQESWKDNHNGDIGGYKEKESFNIGEHRYKFERRYKCYEYTIFYIGVRSIR